MFALKKISCLEVINSLLDMNLSRPNLKFYSNSKHVAKPCFQFNFNAIQMRFQIIQRDVKIN